MVGGCRRVLGWLRKLAGSGRAGRRKMDGEAPDFGHPKGGEWVTDFGQKHRRRPLWRKHWGPVGSWALPRPVRAWCWPALCRGLSSPESWWLR
jgi:hypothetical protein